MPIFVSTESVPQSERFLYWRHTMLDIFKASVNNSSEPEETFGAELALHNLGRVSLLEMVGSPFCLSYSAEANADELVAHVQLIGDCVLRQDRREVHLTPGCICLQRNCRAFELEMDERFRYVRIAVEEIHFAEVFPRWKQTLMTPVPANHGAAAVFVDLVKSLCRQREALEPSVMEWISESTIRLLCSALLHLAEDRRPDGLQMELYHKETIKQYVRSQLHNPDLDVPSIAKAVGLSASYIHRLFAHEHLHLMHWVWVQRLENCHRELCLDHKRLSSDIAYSWGFRSPAHFSRAFRRHFGLSPREIRSQAHRHPEK